MGWQAYGRFFRFLSAGLPLFEMGMTPAEDVRFHHRDSAALFSCAVVGTCSSDVFVVWRERACVRACVRARDARSQNQPRRRDVCVGGRICRRLDILTHGNPHTSFRELLFGSNFSPPPRSRARVRGVTIRSVLER